VKLDGIVLDLDDTIYDTTGLLLPAADRRAVQAMRDAGLTMDEAAACARLVQLRAAGHPAPIAELAREAAADERCATIGAEAWFVYEPPEMTLTDDVQRALADLASIAPLVLLTAGNPATQRKKAERLGLASRFAELRFADFRDAGGKTAALASIIADHRWTASRVVMAGDRPDGDVRAGNRNGCLTVLVRRPGAEFANVAPAEPDDVPWRIVRSVSELPALLR
jgi:putative hydrolase of the HAD superfamily